jgi:TrmH family RNA methyltransferase
MSQPADRRPDVMDHFVVVLHETQDLVNIAGTVRAMANTGLRRLRLVAPVEFDAWRITGIAHGTEPIVEAVEFFDTLEEALADCAHVVGTSARRRTGTYVWAHARAAAPELVDFASREGGPVALLFGREDKGLSNEQLDRCSRIITVPTDPAHPSLNLAQAVLLVGYEIWTVGGGTKRALPRPKRDAAAATVGQLEDVFTDWERTLDTVEFFKSRNGHAIMRTLRAVFRRAQLNEREARLLRAMAIEVRKHVERVVSGVERRRKRPER